jgi:hypothetical protein
MSFNNQIDKLIEKNKHLKPVNMTHYDNPFLLLSEVRALNELIANTLPSSRAEVGDIEPNDSHILGSGLTIYEPSSNNAENLARHVMNEVYTSPENRREIQGYTMLNSFGDDRNVVYKSNKSNTILYGIRGTKPTSGTDWVTDLEIASSATLNILPTGHMKERYDNANNIYSKLRELYPKSKIILSGHSLGNSVGLDILYKHQADNNIELYGYNGYLHPIYAGKKDPRNHPQRTEGDIVSWWNSDKAKSFKTPMVKGVAISGAVVIGAYVANKIRKIKALEGRIKAGNELYARSMVLQNRGVAMAVLGTDADGVTIPFPGGEPFGMGEPLTGEALKTHEMEELERFLGQDLDAKARQWDSVGPREKREILREMEEEYDINWGADVIPEVDYTAVENNIAINFPELTDWTDELRDIGYIPDGYKYKVYLSDGDKGIDDIVFSNPSAEEFANQLNPATASGIINQTRITTSEILAEQMTASDILAEQAEAEVEGRRNEQGFLDYLEETFAEDEEYANILAERTALTSTLELAPLLGYGALILGIAYGFYSHLSGNFKPEKNRFISKKKP